MFRTNTRARLDPLATGVRSTPHPRRAEAIASAKACALMCVAFWVPFAAADGDFSDFRIPKNRTLLWTGNLSARAGSRDASLPAAQSSSGATLGGASTRFSWLSDSDPALTTLDVVLSASGSRGHQNSETQSPIPPASSAQSEEVTDRNMFERWVIGASHRSYPWAAPLGLDASLHLSGDYGQQWNSTNLHGLFVAPPSTFENRQQSNFETWRYSTVVVASASLGWGRVRNATAIYDAMVLERRLLETGALARPLSRDGRRRLAEVLYLRGSLDTVRERPGRLLWHEIERVLADDGALREGGLDPYSVLRAAEPHLGPTRRPTADGVPVSPVLRQTGYFVGLSALDAHQNLIQRDDLGSSYETIQDGVSVSSGSSSASRRATFNSDVVYGGATGTMNRPIGPSWQFDANGDVLLGLRKEDNQLIFDAAASLGWLAADRWTANAYAFYRRLDDDRTEGATAGDSWQWTAGIRVSWYVEDRTAIELSASENQDWLRGTADAPSVRGTHHFFRGLDASLAVTYRFSGWIATPGFFPAPAGGFGTPRAQP